MPFKPFLLAVAGLALSLVATAATPSIAERLDRAERFQDWAAVQALSRQFAFERRGDLDALTSVLDGCIARRCDESALVASLHGPLMSEDVREFARAWLQYAGREPAAARPRFEALSREPATAWLGAYGRLAYAADARNASLLRDAVRDARANPAVAADLSDDILSAELVLASLEGDDPRAAALATQGGDAAAALLAAFAQQLAADDFASAEKTLRRYAERWGEDQDLVASRIELSRARRAPGEVAAEVKAALAAHPGYWKLRLAMAQALAEADDDAGAQELLAGEFPEGFAGVRLELTVLRRAIGGNRGTDVAGFARELEPYGDYPDAQAVLAAAMLDAGRTEEAGALLDRADAMTKALPGTLNVRARIARDAGKTAEYLHLLERATARTPHEVTSQLMLGLAYAKAGEAVNAGRVAAALRRSPRFVPKESIELLERATREADPTFRSA